MLVAALMCEYDSDLELASSSVGSLFSCDSILTVTGSTCEGFGFLSNISIVY